ncbi:glycosyltransferase family 4 protein [Spirosoma radiotolerans]|uniref:Glycosyl transferase family 1 n=1 Tax=Spirosoma radiotolerans TaxID=1379870 RepID=A0A0E3ZYQ5_9BACT|nr:glycosyltransferase family 4 protein [Spirosoma radiotolerans]AKD56940.1 glycosyl transferase family 1 [Spirosoma radiotolerans]
MNVLYLTFYFEPDIGPGSFRNTALVQELSRQLRSDDAIHVITTRPNRYQAYKPTAPEHEQQGYGNCPVTIDRIQIPTHKSGQLDQIRAFWTYFRTAYRLARRQKYDLVVASSSRLFTAFLGAVLVQRMNSGRNHRIPFYLDIRDLFREVMLEMHPNLLVRFLLNVVLRPVEWYTFSRANHINLVSEGFQTYFRSFRQATYSYFTNGIDNVFLTIPKSVPGPPTRIKTLLYAGNIGQGQGMHKIIPQAARQLGEGYRFVIFGSGGAKNELESRLRAENVTNVEIREPVSQAELVIHYQNADYLFLHLNDLAAFTRVLPSKLFEYGATDKPIVAGVAGYAASFVRQHLPNAVVFVPGDVADLVRQVHETLYCTCPRTDFRATFRREAISQAMVRQLLETLGNRLQIQLNRPNETPV